MSCRIDSLPGDIQRELFFRLDGQTLAKTLAPVNAKAQAFLDQPTSHPDIVGLRLSLGRFNITHFQATLPRVTQDRFRRDRATLATSGYDDQLVIAFDDKTRWRPDSAHLKVDLQDNTVHPFTRRSGPHLPMPAWSKKFQIRREGSVMFDYKGTSIRREGENTLSIQGTLLKVKGAILKDFVLTPHGSLVVQTDLSLQVYDMAHRTLTAEYDCHLGDYLTFNRQGTHLIGMRTVGRQAYFTKIDFTEVAPTTAHKNIPLSKRVAYLVRHVAKTFFIHFHKTMQSGLPYTVAGMVVGVVNILVASLIFIPALLISAMAIPILSSLGATVALFMANVVTAHLYVLPYFVAATAALVSLAALGEGIFQGTKTFIETKVL